MFRADNLAGATLLTPCGSVKPWDFDLDVKTAELGEPFIRGLMLDKKGRTVFMTARETKWDVYCAAEGLDPNRRISKENPVNAIHALVADFDTKLSESFVATANQLSLAPSWLEQSLSGNFRLVWLFESPIPVLGRDHATAFLEEIAKATKLRRIAPGLDDKSFEAGQMWTNGGRWMQMLGRPLPADMLTGLCIKALKNVKKEDEEGGVVTDMVAMREALAERYPRFSDWPGEFNLESQGPSFWLDDSTSPMSAIVKPWGMFTFAAGAPKAGYSWAELVGKDICDQIVSRKVSEAAGEIYFDGTRYYLNSQGQWYDYGADSVSRHLRVAHGVSSVRGPDGVSQMDEVLHSIELQGRVRSVAPCIPLPAGRIEWDGVAYLNTWVDHVTRPLVGETPKWGAGFPRIAEHIEVVFRHPEDPDEPQKDRFLDWLSCFYVSLLEHRPQKGQAVFLMGTAGIGKGLLSGIVSGLVGGSTKAEALLTGRTDFGGEVYNAPLMRVDDMIGLDTRAAVINFTEGIKGRVANDTQQFHQKHQKPAPIPWFGRIMVTLNDDEESKSVLPDFGSTVEDKISLFEASPILSKFVSDFATWAERQNVLKQEMPAFAAYLLGHHKGIAADRLDSRWGVKAYHFPRLRVEVEESQTLATLQEPVIEWARQLFANNSNLETWEGTVAQLYPCLIGAKLIGAGTAYPYANATRLGRALGSLSKLRGPDGNPMVVRRKYLTSKVSARWDIYRRLAETSL